MWKRSCDAKPVCVERFESRTLLSVSFSSKLAGAVAVLGPNDNRVADCVALQADGRIVVAGHSAPSDDDGALILRRYNTDGSIDPSFNHGKPASIDLTPIIDAATAIQFDSAGRIVVLVHSHSGEEYDSTQSFGIVRFNSDGTLDKSFATGGVVGALPFLDIASLTTFPNGRIDVAGHIDEQGDVDSRGLRVAQFTSNGKLDAGFDQDGLKDIGRGDDPTLIGAAADHDQLLLLYTYFVQSGQ